MGQHLKPKVLKALQGSIKKWEDVLTGKIPDKGSDNCPLCQMFVVPHGECTGCPVQRYTGKEACDNTPYTDRWRKAERAALYETRTSRRLSEYAMTLEQIQAARAELDFLRSLLPKRLQIKLPR